jgi:hypothetical protein
MLLEVTYTSSPDKQRQDLQRAFMWFSSSNTDALSILRAHSAMAKGMWMIGWTGG